MSFTKYFGKQQQKLPPNWQKQKQNQLNEEGVEDGKTFSFEMDKVKKELTLFTENCEGFSLLIAEQKRNEEP